MLNIQHFHVTLEKIKIGNTFSLETRYAPVDSLVQKKKLHFTVILKNQSILDGVDSIKSKTYAAVLFPTFIFREKSILWNLISTNLDRLKESDHKKSNF